MNEDIQLQRNMTLYQLLENGVIVPDYQRDYAQGRTNDNKIEETRRNFVADILEAAKPDGKRVVHTGLVYGSVNKDLKEYVAVDGQQRLTTMFLFHLYLAKKLNLAQDSETIKVLKRFGWHGRTYASEFTDFLFDASWNANDGCSLVESLESSSQFFKIWKRDPSVNCMLTMLGEIDRQLADREDKQRLLDSLISEHTRLVFDYMRLDEGTDEFQYQKMNSRGRDLTTFELFKQKLQDEEKGLSGEFKRKMDNEWLEFFDERARENGFEADVYYQNFINEIAFIYGVKLRGKDFPYIVQFNDSKVLKGNDVGFVSFDAYDCFRANIHNFEKYLDWLCENKNENLKRVETGIERFAYSEENTRFTDIFEKSSNYTTRAFCYAVMHYARKSEYAQLNQANFALWWRPIHNLIANTNISRDNFKDIMLSIDDLPIVNLEEHLSQNAIKAFNREQRDEEKFKANHPELREKFIEQEKRKRFKGHISVLLPDEEDIALIAQWDTIVDCFDTLTERWTEIPSTTDFNFIQALLSMHPSDKRADYIGKRSLTYKYDYLREGVVSEMVHKLLFKYIKFRIDNLESNLSNFFRKCRHDWTERYETMSYTERRNNYWMKYIYDHSELCSKAFNSSSNGQFTPKWGHDWTLTVFFSKKKNANPEDLLISNRREQVIEKLMGKEAAKHVQYGHQVYRYLPGQYDFIRVCFERDTIWLGIPKLTDIEIIPIQDGSGIWADDYYKARIWVPWDKTNDFYEHENESVEDYLESLCEAFHETLGKFENLLKPRPRTEIKE